MSTLEPSPHAVADGARPASPGRARKPGRGYRIAGWTLIALGAVILEFALYELVGTSMVTKNHQNALREEFEQLIDDPVVDPAPAESPAADPPPRPIDSRAIALLKIPKVDVDVIVVEGVNLSQLSRGPGRYPSTAKFGAQGSTAIAGHRTGWGSPFLNLDKLQSGDEITVESVGGKLYRYRVTKRVIVGPEAVWVLRGNPDSEAASQLTLTTCDPKFTSRNRMIVWADLISSETVA
ncbi:MAG TPA: class E sortase [Actinomycetota bacterium]|nr:class E sortase [Actinomycetota bacterium]